jgi:hypothetical protein
MINKPSPIGSFVGDVITLEFLMDEPLRKELRIMPDLPCRQIKEMAYRYWGISDDNAYIDGGGHGCGIRHKLGLKGGSGRGLGCGENNGDGRGHFRIW